MSFGTGVTGDARARDILVPEAGNIPLDQIRNPNEVLQFVIRRMAAAVRTNATREDLVAKHLVLKGLRQTIVPLPLSGQPNTSSKVEEQLDSSRREIHKVEQKLQRYYIEAEVGWRQLGLTFALGHLPSLAEVRDVEGVRVWIDGIKNDIGRYLEVRMQDDLRRAEARVVQAANAPRPRDDEMERRIFEISKAQEDIRIEQAKQRRLDNAGVLHRLEALEREMHDRRQMDADAHTEIESVTKRLTDLEDVFGYTRADLDTLIEKMDGMAAKEDRIDDVEKELRGIIDSAIAWLGTVV
ncbi:hypothetical protein DACRYDRAFT_102828 [Dacryopinax primogenitus]|uniref:Uncharacterized protein n=1 Tax=Dacryopinax primogenitus (strain DJM 731) TaxID=1858805 RepID=M5FQ04_DACPD|nr:uncharacterized protein DACRYDRAFT_102828 [Dacryopinax primogenitus]EJT96654.1 hypothetical protein DACRYDRAFT_102828 [Dacryopinax primogenitus]